MSGRTEIRCPTCRMKLAIKPTSAKPLNDYRLTDRLQHSGVPRYQTYFIRQNQPLLTPATHPDAAKRIEMISHGGIPFNIFVLCASKSFNPHRIRKA
jgi:hypothetical protein